MSEPVPPLTEQEQQTLNELQQQQALYDWQQAENERLAKLALIEPVALALDCIEPCIADLEAAEATLEGDELNRVSRILQILRFDGRTLVNRYNELSQPTPSPVADPEPTP